MSQKWSLGRKSGSGSRRPGHWGADDGSSPPGHWGLPLDADPGPSTGWDVRPAAEPTPPIQELMPTPSPEPVVVNEPPPPVAPEPEPEPEPAPTPAAVQMGERVAESIGVWQSFVTDLVAEVDRKAAEHLATIEATAAQRHRELSEAVGAVGDDLRRQAADVAAAMERQATEVLRRVEERFRAIAAECATTVAVAEQAAEAWRVTIDNAGTAKQSELDATMAKHLLGVEDVVLRTREELEGAAETQLSRFESQVATLREGLRRESEDQTLAFEDLAALRLVELEERLGQAVDALIPGSNSETDHHSAPRNRNGDSNGAGDIGPARAKGLRSIASG